jgi:hypothetical protein
VIPVAGVAAVAVAAPKPYKTMIPDFPIAGPFAP